jgi:hypothetical protein
MTTIQRIGAEILGGVLLIAGVLLWWNLHNRAEQKQGAQACIQATTIDKTEAVAQVVSTQAAEAVDINAVVKGYDAKVADLSARNDDLAGRLSASGAIRASRVSHSGSAAAGECTKSGVDSGQSETLAGLARVRADLDELLAAGDANQVKTEDLATLYDGVRTRALAAAAAAPPAAK